MSKQSRSMQVCVCARIYINNCALLMFSCSSKPACDSLKHGCDGVDHNFHGHPAVFDPHPSIAKQTLDLCEERPINQKITMDGQ